MNQKALESIVTFYKANYQKIEKNELYKWKAVKTFQDNWNIEADNFYAMLNASLHDTSNLMSAGNYYPRRMILWMAEKDSDTVREMFRELYDLSIDFKDRVHNFRETAKLLIEMHKEKNVHHHYQDDRAIMVYLNLRYPEKYYLYKYTMFKDFVERTDYDDSPKSGDFENLFKFESLCKYIHNYMDIVCMESLAEEGYPESLLALLEMNPEAENFVLHYLEKKDGDVEIDISGEVSEGTIPLFLQWDERWGYETYGNDFLAVTGCGPTCLSMVLA